MVTTPAEWQIGQRVQLVPWPRFKGEIVLIGADCSKHGPACKMLKVSWDAGHARWEHSNLLELALSNETDNTGHPDKADEVYSYGLMANIEGNPRILDILGDEPFMVIGDFAYILGYDGSVYLAPYNSDVWVGATRRKASYKTVKWADAVEITNHYDTTDFPSNRLASHLSDLSNIRDIMRQHGVKVETDK